MSESASEINLRSNRIQRAANRVTDYWIPFNPQVMRKVICGLEYGAYDDRLDQLIRDISGDLSLFSFCTLKLIELMKERGDEFAGSFDPLTALYSSSVQQLKSILTHRAEKTSAHSFEAGTELQVSRFHEAFVSAGASRVLGEQECNDGDMFFRAALIRQLGLALIAWNYPSVYEECMQELPSGKSLDVALAARLGFSPTLLATRLFVNCGVPLQSCQRFGLYENDDLIDEDSFIRESVGNTLAKVCSIGEALARAQYPDRYPTARDDWEYASRAVRNRLGEGGMGLIQEQLTDLMADYIDYAPDIFRAGTLVDPINSVKTGDDDQPKRRNPYLLECAPQEQEALKRLYEKLDSDPLSGNNLRVFFDDTFSATKFSGGCIFTVDPTTMKFIPQVELGQLTIRSCEAVDYSIAASNSDSVSVAYQSSEPVIGYSISNSGELYSVLSGVIGVSQRVGVLYLEIPGLVSDRPKEVMHFNAMRFAINDCLGL